MIFSQKSDVKKHLAHLFNKTHYLTPDDQSRSAENGDEVSASSGGTAALLDDREPILVVTVQ